MDVPMPRSKAGARRSVSAFGRLTLIGLVGLAAAFVYLQAIMIGMLIPPLAIFAVISLVLAGVVATGWRWAPLLGALWSGFLVTGNLAEIQYGLGHPAEFQGFVFNVYTLVMATLGFVGGLAATFDRVRGRDSTRALPGLLAGLAGLALGAILVAAVAGNTLAAGISPETLDSLPALRTTNFAFDQPELRVKAGELVALRLENSDNEGHSFDIDELGVHALMPADKPGAAVFKPSVPGTYTFYCAPHYDKATGEGMKGTLIVE